MCHSDPVVAGEESRSGSGAPPWEERIRAGFLPFPLASLGVRVGMTPVFRGRVATCTEALDALTQVRHEEGQEAVKCFRISSGYGRVYTTFKVQIEAVG